MKPQLQHGCEKYGKKGFKLMNMSLKLYQETQRHNSSKTKKQTNKNQESHWRYQVNKWYFDFPFA